MPLERKGVVQVNSHITRATQNVYKCVKDRYVGMIWDVYNLIVNINISHELHVLSHQISALCPAAAKVDPGPNPWAPLLARKDVTGPVNYRPNTQEQSQVTGYESTSREMWWHHRKHATGPDTFASSRHTFTSRKFKMNLWQGDLLKLGDGYKCKLRIDSIAHPWMNAGKEGQSWQGTCIRRWMARKIRSGLSTDHL